MAAGYGHGNFTFGDVEWVNYRGTDDNSTVSIGTTKCRFIPVGIPTSSSRSIRRVNRWSVVGTSVRSSTQVVPDPSGYNEFVEIDLATYRLDMRASPQALPGSRGLLMTRGRSLAAPSLPLTRRETHNNSSLHRPDYLHAVRKWLRYGSR